MNPIVVTEMEEETGRELVRLLVEKGERVRCIVPDRHRDDRSEHELLRDERVDVLRCRLDDELGLAAALRGAAAAFICYPPKQRVNERSAIDAFVNAVRDTFLPHVVILLTSDSRSLGERAVNEIARVIPSTTVLRVAAMETGAARLMAGTLARRALSELFVRQAGIRRVDVPRTDEAPVRT